MAAYVDELQPNLFRFKRWRYSHYCHLTADTLEELHEFAQRLGLRKGWFQGNRKYPHYDLTANKRIQALGLGAVEISAREWIRRTRNA